jgi:hypothetical protein
VGEYPEQVRRRLVPDDAQVQVILGSLLGAGRLHGDAGARWLLVSHELERADYVWWKYERLAAFAYAAPSLACERLMFRTIAHPFFDDVAALLADPTHPRVRRLLAPLGLAVWLADLGRIELREAIFVPHRSLALSA